MVGTGGPVATFSVWDYVVFAGLILFAAGIGLFQAIRGRKETSSEDFLLGGRQMTAVPVALSLTASFMSGITVIGTPAEAYMYGTPFWIFVFSYAIMSIISAEIFVPLFYRLGITSTYEVRGRHRAQGVCMRTENRDRLETHSFVPVFDKESIDGNAMRTREGERIKRKKAMSG